MPTTEEKDAVYQLVRDMVAAKVDEQLAYVDVNEVASDLIADEVQERVYLIEDMLSEHVEQAVVDNASAFEVKRELKSHLDEYVSSKEFINSLKQVCPQHVADRLCDLLPDPKPTFKQRLYSLFQRLKLKVWHWALFLSLVPLGCAPTHVSWAVQTNRFDLIQPDRSEVSSELECTWEL